MFIGARCGFTAILLIGSIGTGTAQSQSVPSGWTDPPIRGSAAPPAAKVEPDAPAAAKPAETVAAPDKVATPESKPDAVAEAQPVRRSAGLRRERIRNAAVRANRYATTRSYRSAAIPAYENPRSRITQRPRVHADHYYARRYGEDRRYAARVVGLYPSRRAGWGGLLGTARDRRIAEAQEAGYIVMRSRTYIDPYGNVARTFRPIDTDEFY